MQRRASKKFVLGWSYHRKKHQIIAKWVDKRGVRRLDSIGSDQSKNRSDWIKRIRPNIAEWMRARRAERRIHHRVNFWKVYIR